MCCVAISYLSRLREASECRGRRMHLVQPRDLRPLHTASGVRQIACQTCQCARFTVENAHVLSNGLNVILEAALSTTFCKHKDWICQMLQESLSTKRKIVYIQHNQIFFSQCANTSERSIRLKPCLVFLTSDEEKAVPFCFTNNVDNTPAKFFDMQKVWLV